MSSCLWQWHRVPVPLIPLFPSVSLSPSSTCITHIAPLSTPQAIACGSGWGCFMGPVSSSPFPLAHPPSCLPSPLSFLHCRCHHVIPVPLLHSSHLSPGHPLAILLPHLDSSPPRTTLQAAACRDRVGAIMGVLPSHCHCSCLWWWCPCVVIIISSSMYLKRFVSNEKMK